MKTRIYYLLQSFYKWFPIIFLLLVWYVPRQTAPGGWFEKYIILRWITLIIIPVWGGIQLIINILQRRKLNLTNIILPMSSFFLILVISCLINKTSFSKMIGVSLLYLRYPALFIILINMDLPKNILNVFTRLFGTLLFLQIPECLYRSIFLGVRGDDISWTLGRWGTMDLGVYSIYFTSILVAYGILKKIKLLHFVFIGAFFIFALLGEIRAFYFAVFPVALMVAISEMRRYTKQKLLRAGFIFFLMLTFATITLKLWPTVYPQKYDFFTTLVDKSKRKKIISRYFAKIANTERKSQKSKNLDKKQTVIERSLVVTKISTKIGRTLRSILYFCSVDRIRGIYDFFVVINPPLINKIFGMGPGSSFKGNFWKEKGKIYNYKVNVMNQMIRILADAGLLGMAVFYWLLFNMLSVFIKVNNIGERENLRIFVPAVIGMWFFYGFIAPHYILVWRYDSSSFIYFFYSAMIYKFWYERSAKPTRVAQE